MESVKEILQVHGYNNAIDLEIGDPVTVEKPGYMDLVIEKIGDQRVSVGHYYTQMGDLMSDPEIVFKTSGEEWIPVRYTEHPHIHQYDETGLTSASNFVKQWDRNLRIQGYIKAAKQQAVQP